MRALSPFAFLGATLILAASAAGQSPEGKPLDALSLSDLLGIEVVTPAAVGQKVAASPAVVSVLTAEQIRDLGVTTLYEALSYLPGVQVMETYFGYTAVNVRGVLQTHYNNKVLMMVNGHPWREVVNGSFHLEVVPVEAVSRIELIRGPGSALYGTNAFAGVVNVITRQGDDPGARVVAAGGGTFATFEGSAGFGQRTEDLDVAVTASYRTDDGYPFRVRADERGQSGQLDYRNRVGNLFAHLAYRGLTVEVAAFSQAKEKLGITPVLDYTGTSEYQGGFLDLRFDHSPTDRLDLTTRLRYDTVDRLFEVGSFPYDGFLGHASADMLMDSSGSLLAGEVNLAYSHSERLSLLGGVVYEQRETDPYVFRFADDGSLHPFSSYLDSHSAHDLALFAQGLVGLGDRTELVLGLRAVDDSDAGSALLPRLGLVHRLGDATYLKVLYAEAFRSPDFFEKHVSTYDVLYGNPQLDRESTRTLDVALDTTLAGRYNLQVNAFVLRTDDVIVRVPTPDPDRTGPAAGVYVNGPGDEIWGVEAALMAQPLPQTRLFASYAFLDGEARQTGESLAFFARHTASAALVWRMADTWAFKPNLQYVGSRGEVDDYTVFNLVVTLELRPDLSLDLVGRNLTDAATEYPEYVRQVITAIPGVPPRAFLARARLVY